MSRRKPQVTPQDGTLQILEFQGFLFDCDIPVAVNPITRSECRLVPPVKIRCFEDFARFYERWEEFCKDLGGNPEEVCFPF